MRGIRNHTMGWWVAVVLAGLACETAPNSALAQITVTEEAAREQGFRIRRVVPEFVSTPDVQTSYAKRGVVGGTPVKWLRVEVEFDTVAEWSDNVETRWFVLVAGEKKPVVFSDSVTHINIKRGSRHLGVIFMPPRTVDRYAKLNQVKMIAVQVWHDQRLEDTGGWPNPPTKRWWEDYSPVHGALLNLLQTPFGMLEYDRYEQIKVSSTP